MNGIRPFAWPLIAFVLAHGEAHGIEGSWEPIFGVAQPAGSLRCATMFDGELYVGGDFRDAGRVVAPYVAVLQQGRWRKPLGELPGPAVAFAQWQDSLIVVGNLTDAQGYRRGFVARKSETDWVKLGSTFEGEVTGILIDEGELYVYGKHLYRWIGNGWVSELSSNEGSFAWVCRNGTTLYAAHSVLGLMVREDLGWSRTMWNFFADSCARSGSILAPSRCATSFDGDLWIFGDFWAAEELLPVDATRVSSPAAIRFDGRAFRPVNAPWISACVESRPSPTKIQSMGSKDDLLLAVGEFRTVDSPSTPVPTIAHYRDGSWRIQSGVVLQGRSQQIALGDDELYLLSSGIRRRQGVVLDSVGRIARIEPSSLQLEPIAESAALGLLNGQGEVAAVTAMAMHRGAVALAADAELPIGMSVEESAGYLLGLRGDALEVIPTSLPVRATALLATAGGLIVAHDEGVLRIQSSGAVEPIVASLDGHIFDIAEYDDSLIFAGQFSSIDGHAITNAARVSSSGVESLGNPNGPVLAIALWNGDLILAGDFTHIGDVDAASIARFDHGSWRAMGDGFTRATLNLWRGRVEALWVWNGELVAAGDFLASGETPLMHAARYQNGTWAPLTRRDLNGPARCVVEHDGQLVFGGEFYYADDTFVGGVATFDGSTWRDLGANANGPVLSILSQDGDLVVGGEFTRIGGRLSYGVGRWRAAPREESGFQPPMFAFRGVEPNPSVAGIRCKVWLSQNGPVELRIFDSRGRVIRTIQRSYVLRGEREIAWDGLDERGDRVSSGVYYLQMRAEGRSSSQKAVIIGKQ